MFRTTTPYICRICRHAARYATHRRHLFSSMRGFEEPDESSQFTHERCPTGEVSTSPPIRPTFAPKPSLNLKHMRENPGLYEQNCLDRNYKSYSRNAWEILLKHEISVQGDKDALAIRQTSKEVQKKITQTSGAEEKNELIQKAQSLKLKTDKVRRKSIELDKEMELLALQLPNLSSFETPVGDEPQIIGWINGDAPPRLASERGHVEIGKALDIIDFEGSSHTSGWGWYFLKNEGAFLEQALIQYTLHLAASKGWNVMTPPSLVYSHVAAACGFMPRDQNNETQIYNITPGDNFDPHTSGSLVLAGTAEIPFAGSRANQILFEDQLPLKVIGPSRCYRAEAGARGVDTKGLYRVHEFTKVEMFAWTRSRPASDTERFDDGTTTEQDDDPALSAFHDMHNLQIEILTSLGLHARILEMPTTDLGASAQRKIDIEAYFPSRAALRDNGYGEVTSASMCGDYQTRRLNTRTRPSQKSGGRIAWPQTVNGTALAVPRIIAALLENGWNEETKTVTLPKVLGRWMPANTTQIGPAAFALEPSQEMKVELDGYNRGYPVN